jgi:hypothetical protein
MPVILHKIDGLHELYFGTASGEQVIRNVITRFYIIANPILAMVSGHSMYDSLASYPGSYWAFWQ